MDSSVALSATVEEMGAGENYRIVNGYMEQLDSGAELEDEQLDEFAGAIGSLASDFEAADLDLETIDAVERACYKVIDHTGLNKNTPQYARISHDLTNLIGVLGSKKQGLMAIGARKSTSRHEIERASAL